MYEKPMEREKNARTICTESGISCESTSRIERRINIGIVLSRARKNVRKKCNQKQKGTRAQQQHEQTRARTHTHTYAK